MYSLSSLSWSSVLESLSLQETSSFTRSWTKQDSRTYIAD
jgi:hypothetical protein